MFIIPVNFEIKVTPLNKKFKLVANHLAVFFVSDQFFPENIIQKRAKINRNKSK